MAKGTPGNPPPVPKSTTSDPPGRADKRGAAIKLSQTSLKIASGRFFTPTTLTWRLAARIEAACRTSRTASASGSTQGIARADSCRILARAGISSGVVGVVVGEGGCTP